jgi:hypothetical protein
MSDQTLPIPTGGDPASVLVEVIPPGEPAPVEAPAPPAGTPLDSVDTLRWNIDRAVTLASILQEYTDTHFKPGIDFGSARGKAGDKPTLLKPGGEKLIAVLGLRVKFVPDRASLAMAGNPAGLFAYKCLLINWQGEIVGEGRGACSTAERSNMTINNAIKMAEKRAQGDAICRVACVSEHFTSDDDAPNEERQEPRQEPRQAPQATQAPNPPQRAAPAPGVQPGADGEPISHKAYVWAYYKGNRRAHNLSLDDDSVIADINDFLRSFRLGATVNTATPAEWARAYAEIRKLPAPPKAASAAPDYEEIFN